MNRQIMPLDGIIGCWLLAVGYWLAYGNPSSSRLGIVSKLLLLSLRSVG
ncbi:MAG: hypothetical protein IJX65_05535 [Alistipes sp.]|nr:hypothetical protein [Alistipes sp.]